MMAQKIDSHFAKQTCNLHFESLLERVINKT